MIRWGIIGCGDVTEVKSGPALQKAKSSSLVAVMRRNATLAQDYAKRHGVARWYDDAQALMHDPEVDIVYIATPVGVHAELACQVASVGKPAYIEKPMARHMPEAQAMVKAFENVGLPLFVAYYRRALPRFLHVKKLLEEGALGALSSIRYHYGSPSHTKNHHPLPWRLNPRDSGGGLFLDLGSHALDILDFLLGPLRNVQGIAHNVADRSEVEDAVAMVFEVGDGIPGTASWNFARHQRIDSLEIEGTEASLRMSVFGETPIEVSHGRSVDRFEFKNPLHIQQPLVQSIVDELMAEGNCPSTGESALRTTQVMDAVLDPYYGGRADRFWERPWPGRVAKR